MSSEETTLSAPAPTVFPRRWAKAKTWALRLAGFASVQLMVQAIGFASGILLVRSLSQEDYALFTIANTIMGTMNLLADSGISSGLTSIGGRVWNDPHRFGQLIHTALGLRRTLASFVVVMGIPITVWLLLKNGASPWLAAEICLAILASLYFQLSNGILTVIPRLLLQTNRLQQIDFTSAVIRLLLICLAWLLLLNTSTALWAATAAFGCQWWLLRRWTRSSINVHAPANPEMRREIMTVVHTQIPNSLFYCLQGQIGIWLLSIFGKVGNVAAIGALGRLAVVLGIISTVMGSLIAPRFSRCHDIHKLKRLFWIITGGCIGLAGGIQLVCFLFTDQCLWILGPKYANYHREFLLMVAVQGIGLISSTMWTLNHAKSFLQYSWLYIPLTIFSQMAVIPLVDLKTIQGVLILSGAPAVVLIFHQILLFKIGLRDLDRKANVALDKK